LIINTDQKDALNELINIGFGRAANALSILVRTRVILQAPEAEVYTVPEIKRAFSIFGESDIGSVYQVFTGSISGTMALLMDLESATALVDLAHRSKISMRKIKESDQEDLAEIGNILLNAFCGSFANLLNLSVTYSTPQYYQSPAGGQVDFLTKKQQEIQYAVVVKVRFHLVEGSVEGYVIILMGVSSLEALFSAIQRELLNSLQYS
jgi:chemotaxis protein CheC